MIIISVNEVAISVVVGLRSSRRSANHVALASPNGEGPQALVCFTELEPPLQQSHKLDHQNV
jgi:hypothetical protein